MVKDDALFWHRRLGRCNMKAVMTTVNVNGDISEKCDICISQKITKVPHKESFSDNEILKTLYIDIGFPVSKIRTYDGNNCYLIGVDGYTKLTIVIPLPSKDSSTVVKALKKMIVMLEISTGKTIKNIRSDNGKEFKNSDVIKFLDDKKISRQYTAV
uniref:Integrase catalytic domain-containing protein n=1 Tax=Strongyloides stercoralis TaxID=6248 RepID=A0AAF5DIX9_STRER